MQLDHTHPLAKNVKVLFGLLGLLRGCRLEESAIVVDASLASLCGCNKCDERSRKEHVCQHLYSHSRVTARTTTLWSGENSAVPTQSSTEVERLTFPSLRVLLLALPLRDFGILTRSLVGLVHVDHLLAPVG
jgi:hypothetical protein